MNTPCRFLSALVLVLTIFCFAVLILHVMQIPQAEIRYAKKDILQPLQPVPKRNENSWSISKLPLIPRWGKNKEIVAVMIENHTDARPHHRGIEDALLIEEHFVEGFITRFIALYEAKKMPKRVGPVRSLRPYFVDGVLPWVSVFFHIGGSPEALEKVEQYDGITSFNGIYRDTYYERVDGIPMPHDAFLSRDSARELLKEAEEMTSVRWPPYKTGRAKSSSGATTISINYFSPLHNVEYVYDAWKKNYIRTNGKDVSLAVPRNILLIETSVKEVGPFGRLAVRTRGDGDVILFRAGNVYHGHWSKESPTDGYIFTDTEGKLLVFASGQTWITVLDSLERIDWEA